MSDSAIPPEQMPHREAWRIHCLPWIQSGHSTIYGSPEDLAREQLKKRPKPQPKEIVL